MILENYKLKQWDSTTYVLEERISKTLTPPNAGENVEQYELSLLVKMQNDVVIFKDSLEVSYKTKHTFTISSSCTAWYLPKGVENLLYTNLHILVYSSFVHQCQNFEATKMSFNRGMDKETGVHSDNEILLSAKNKWIFKPWKDMAEF